MERYGKEGVDFRNHWVLLQATIMLVDKGLSSPKAAGCCARNRKVCYFNTLGYQNAECCSHLAVLVSL